MSLEKFPKPSFLFKVSACEAERSARHRPKAGQLALLVLSHPPLPTSTLPAALTLALGAEGGK